MLQYLVISKVLIRKLGKELIIVFKGIFPKAGSGIPLREVIYGSREREYRR